MKHIFSKFRTQTRSGDSTPEEPSSPADNWPFLLEQLRKAAVESVNAARRTHHWRLSSRERAEHEDLTVMRAMADRKKTAAVYFVMSEALSTHRGRPLSDQELVEADELNRALRQDPLSDEERRAIEGLARKGHIACHTCCGGGI